MSFWAEVVKQSLELLDLRVGVRWLGRICVASLLLVGYFDRSALSAGVASWVHEVECRGDRQLVTAEGRAGLPRMIVKSTSTGCVLKASP